MLCLDLRNSLAAMGILVGSYLIAAFINASPITQPVLTSPYVRGSVVVVVRPTEPAPEAEPGPLPAEMPATAAEGLRAL